MTFPLIVALLWLAPLFLLLAAGLLVVPVQGGLLLVRRAFAGVAPRPPVRRTLA